MDTNILSDLIKNPRGVIAERMLTPGLEIYCCTSFIVACELRYSAEKKQLPKLSFNVEQVLNSLPILPLEESVDKVYAEIRVNLEGRGFTYWST